MLPSDQVQPGQAGAEQAEPRTVLSAREEILACARQASSKHGFLAGALESLARTFASPYSALYARCGSGVIQEEKHQGPTDPRFWRAAVQQFLTDSLAEDCARAKVLSARDASLKIALLSAPLSGGAGGVSGAIVVVIRGDQRVARAQLPVLEALVGLISSAADLVGAATASQSAAGSAAPSQALARAAMVSTPEELAFALTNNLRTKLGCQQVALGLVRGRHIRIISISGLDDVNRRSPGVTRLRAAMEECLDLGEPIVCQSDGGWDHENIASGYRLHEQWRELAGGPSVATIPLHANQACVAVLALRRRADEPFRKDNIEDIRKVVEPFAAALLLVRKATRGVPRHAWESAGQTVRGLVGPGRLGLKVFTAIMVLATAWFCCGTLDYRVTTAGRIIPAERRQLAAPFNGTLSAATAIPGDIVRGGDVLCEFDQRDLELERRRLEAELAVLEREHMRALAADQPVEAKLAEAQRHLAQTQLDIISRRIEQSVCRAPFDGVVVSGDLRRQVGSVLAQGEPLFEIAPLGRWVLELEVPQSAAADLRPGLGGQFAGNARPEAAQPFTLARLCPSAEVRDGRNVYVAEASFESRADWLRPGMEGVARVHVGPRRVWWVTLHKTLDYLRLKFWL